MKRIFLFFILLVILTGCNLPTASNPAFVPPSELNLTPGQEWEALVQAATQTAQAAQVINFQPTSEPEPVENEEPIPTPMPTVTPTRSAAELGPILYTSMAGDTLEVVAVRFGVDPGEITSPQPIPEMGYINPNQLLVIPNRLGNTTSSVRLLPDSEVVYSPSSIDFDPVGYAKIANGYLNEYKEFWGGDTNLTGPRVLERVAIDNSINPRLLLGLLEYQSNWVSGQPGNLAEKDYPLGYISLPDKDLKHQLIWAVNQLSIGYYGWREGRLTEITFTDGVTARLSPEINAGTAALQYYFAQLYDSQGWMEATHPETGFMALYTEMFGNPWLRAQAIEPLLPPDLTQPKMNLPFLIGPIWSYTGGPHGAWERDGSWAAIDFAPSSTVSGCVDSDAWVAASAAGLVVRSERGIVTIDLDGDGYEQTGWVLVYLHIATDRRIDAGSFVDFGDLLGHPSCEGGYSTGTHLHMARKFNGEWMFADGPIPFVLSGWQAHAGNAPYKGTLTRGDDIVQASQYGSAASQIKRYRDDP